MVGVTNGSLKRAAPTRAIGVARCLFARAPGAEAEGQVGGVDRAVIVQVGGEIAGRGRAPVAEDDCVVGRVYRAVAGEIRRARVDWREKEGVLDAALPRALQEPTLYAKGGDLWLLPVIAAGAFLLRPGRRKKQPNT